jgi:hypothetical protein
MNIALAVSDMLKEAKAQDGDYTFICRVRQSDNGESFSVSKICLTLDMPGVIWQADSQPPETPV